MTHLQLVLMFRMCVLRLIQHMDNYAILPSGVEEETSAHILCECDALASFRHVHLGSFFLEPEDIQSISLGAIWNFSKATGLPWNRLGTQRVYQ